jgi:predicted O-methyltransferase YrrM
MKQTHEIDGWFNHHGAYDFLLSKVPTGGTFVELGAWLGKSSSYLCDKATGQQIIIIDSFKGTQEYIDSYYNLAKTADIYELFVENMGSRKYKAIKATSKAASRKFKDESLDVVFIDLNHSYESVKEDIALWLPKVKKGGYLAGDDYHQNWPGVIQAVNEMLNGFTVIDDAFIFQK